MINLIEDLKGLFDIEFVGDPETRRIVSLGPVFSGDANILYLIGENNTIYNWSTIIKLTKIKE